MASENSFDPNNVLRDKFFGNLKNCEFSNHDSPQYLLVLCRIYNGPLKILEGIYSKGYLILKTWVGTSNITNKQMDKQKGKQNNQANKGKDYDLRYGFFQNKTRKKCY